MHRDLELEQRIPSTGERDSTEQPAVCLLDPILLFSRHQKDKRLTTSQILPEYPHRPGQLKVNIRHHTTQCVSTESPSGTPAHQTVLSAALTHCCTNSTAYRSAIQSKPPAKLHSVFGDSSVSPLSPLPTAFKEWSVRPLLISSFPLLHLTLLHFIYFFLSIPHASIHSFYLQHFSELCLFFFSSAVCIHLKCVHVLFAFSSALAAVFFLPLKPCQRSQL